MSNFIAAHWGYFAAALLLLAVTGWREVKRNHYYVTDGVGRAPYTMITYRHWLGIYRQRELEGHV